MAFTVPTSWQYIDGTHQVAPRAPIVGGKTGSYAFDALIADHHLVRASRMPAVLAMAKTDAWTTTAGPGSGVGSWASFGKVKFETQAGFDGRLNVTAWAKDCQGGAGGVYVAVFNTSSVLQASATLTNTSSGTKQQLTGSITGLSASTEYLIEVRFAARTAGSPTAMLYGVLVEPRALTSSTIDDKLDDQRAKDDESASSLLPYRIRENLIASMRERMPQCAHVYPEESKIQMSAPEVSTHPDEWWGIPIVVPVPRGAVEVGVRIVYEVTTASVKARLRVIGGDIGSAVTLSTTGSTTLSSDLTVAVRSGDSRSALVMLSFQSTRGSAIAVANGATSSDGLASRKVAISLLSGSVTAHSVIQNAGSTKPATYIGSVSGGTNITIWPERWPIADIFGGSVYTLGKIKLHSVGVEVKADASSLVDFSVPTTRFMSVEKVMQYETITNLDAASWEIYSSASRWYAMRPTAAALSSFFGVSEASGAPAAGAIVERRADSEGVEVSLLVISSGFGNRVVETEVTIRSVNGGTSGSITIVGSVSDDIFIGTPQGEQLATQVAGLTDGFGTTDWSAQDLIRESEAEQLGVIKGIAPWPAGSGVGDVLEVTCTVGDGVRHVFGASLREWVRPRSG